MMENFEQKILKKQEKNAKIEKEAEKIIEQFNGRFVDYSVSFAGFQKDFYGTGDSYMFNVQNKKVKSHKASFSVEELDVQMLEDVFIDVVKRFGEDVKRIV